MGEWMVGLQQKLCELFQRSRKSEKHHLADILQVLEISRHLAVIGDLQTLLKQIEDAALKIIDCERATVFVYDANTDQLSSFVSTRKENIQISADQGIAGFCFSKGEVCKVTDAYHDPRFDSTIDELTGFRTRNILAYPMLGNEQRILGVLEVINKSSGVFDQWDELILETFAAQSGVAIHRHLLMRDYVKNQRIKKELAIARQIQNRLLPTSVPRIEGFDIAAWNQAAEETGGDFYDFQQLDNKQLIFVIADVAGHGLGPALLATECSALLRAYFSMDTEITESLTQVNKLFFQHLPDDRFVTVCVGRLIPEQSKIEFVSAGHGPVILLRAANRQIEMLPVSGMPLGVLADNKYTQSELIAFNSGDLLVALTDGFFEWENRQGNCFGVDRVCATIRRYSELSADCIITNLYHELLDYTREIKQQDDLTAVIIKKQ